MESVQRKINPNEIKWLYQQFFTTDCGYFDWYGRLFRTMAWMKEAQRIHDEGLKEWRTTKEGALWFKMWGEKK
jgi:hypothetical protein